MSQVKLPMVWTQHLRDEAAKQNFRDVLVNNSLILDRFLDILKQYEDEVSSKEIKEEHFEKPEFPTRQAYYLGRKAALKQVKDLFTWRLKL